MAADLPPSAGARGARIPAVETPAVVSPLPHTSFRASPDRHPPRPPQPGLPPKYRPSVVAVGRWGVSPSESCSRADPPRPAGRRVGSLGVVGRLPAAGCRPPLPSPPPLVCVGDTLVSRRRRRHHGGWGSGPGVSADCRCLGLNCRCKSAMRTLVAYAEVGGYRPRLIIFK